jgi:hypothetical protein
VCSSFLVRGAPAFCRDRALRLRIHCRESARSLPTHRSSAASIHSTFTSRSACSARSAQAAAATYTGASAPLVHSSLLGVSLVCHYQSPAAISELIRDAAAEETP